MPAGIVGAATDTFAGAGYAQSEYFVSGTATSYRAVGALGDDGKWKVAPAGKAAYTTRILVRRPKDAAKFNGTVLVEWLNVSAGSDTDAEFSYMHPEITRAGYAWVGVSVQQVGVSGGTAVVPVPILKGGGLKAANPTRYKTLQHPGDAFALDIYSQVGRAVRAPGSVDALQGLHPVHVVAIGESQSAFELTTYINAIAPIAHVYDGYFMHSRGGGSIPLEGGNIASAIAGARRIRTDIDVPVFMNETESDETFLGYSHARQPDTDHIRLWDIAGGSHADSFQVGGGARSIGCSADINSAQTHYVLNAALAHFDTWVATGTPPPVAPRMEITAKGEIVRDAHGNARGGVRTPALDAPVASYTGVSNAASVLCLLFGKTTPFDAATLHKLYPDKQAYLDAYTKALDAAIGGGFMLEADRAAILAEAQKVSI
jgi:hypothetical protein